MRVPVLSSTAIPICEYSKTARAALRATVAPVSSNLLAMTDVDVTREHGL